MRIRCNCCGDVRALGGTVASAGSLHYIRDLFVKRFDWETGELLSTSPFFDPAPFPGTLLGTQFGIALNGDTVYTSGKAFDGEGNDITPGGIMPTGFDIWLDPHGYLYDVAGANGNNPVARKIAATGGVLQTYEVVSATPGDKQMASICTDRNGNVWIGGRSNSTSEAVVWKFSNAGTLLLTIPLGPPSLICMIRPYPDDSAFLFTGNDSTGVFRTYKMTNAATPVITDFESGGSHVAICQNGEAYMLNSGHATNVGGDFLPYPGEVLKHFDKNGNYDYAYTGTPSPYGDMGMDANDEGDAVAISACGINDDYDFGANGPPHITKFHNDGTDEWSASLKGPGTSETVIACAAIAVRH